MTKPTLMAQLVELQEENARLREDAERYRWLRDSPYDYSRSAHESAECFDAAIDAAMQGKESGK